MRPEPKLKFKIWSRKLKRRPHATPLQFAAIRCAELGRLYMGRYGEILPNTDEGRLAGQIMVHHMAAFSNAPARIAAWIAHHMPWLLVGEADDIRTEALTRTDRWKADTLAWKLKLTSVDRATLKITTIGAIDSHWLARKGRRKRLQKKLKKERRKEQGKKPHSESNERQKPWKSQRISRATWYRKKRETEMATP